MAWFILAVVVALGIAVWKFIEDGLWWSIGSFFLASFFGAIIALVPLLISSAIITCNSDLVISKCESQLYAFEDSVGIDGAFFLGSGRVNSDIYYYYIECTDLGYKLNNVKSDDAYIKYTTEIPTMNYYVYDLADYRLNWLGFCLKPSYYVFEIPEGSINNNYSVDLK